MEGSALRQTATGGGGDVPISLRLLLSSFLRLLLLIHRHTAKHTMKQMAMKKTPVVAPAIMATLYTNISQYSLHDCHYLQFLKLSMGYDYPYTNM